jgi:hypothetical protein
MEEFRRRVESRTISAVPTTWPLNCSENATSPVPIVILLGKTDQQISGTSVSNDTNLGLNSPERWNGKNFKGFKGTHARQLLTCIQCDKQIIGISMRDVQVRNICRPGVKTL